MTGHIVISIPAHIHDHDEDAPASAHKVEIKADESGIYIDLVAEDGTEYWLTVEIDEGKPRIIHPNDPDNPNGDDDVQYTPMIGEVYAQ
jgi:hypothetical protein